MSTRMTLRIQERRGQLTKAERALADVLAADPALVGTHSATELARLAGVSKATAARFFRTLGYADFDQVKSQAREERNLSEPFAWQPGPPSEGSTGGSAGRAIGDHLRLELDNVARTFEEMRPDLLSEAARLVAEAPRVWCLGLGSEEGLARMARLSLARIRPGVHLLGAQQGAWAEDLAMAGPRDLLLLVSVEPQPGVLAPLLAHARTSRMSVVTVTDHRHLAAARRGSRVAIGCHVASYTPDPSPTALHSVVRLLAATCLDRLGSAGRDRIEMVREIGEELQERPLRRA